MTQLWHFAHPWRDEELKDYLINLQDLKVNFTVTEREEAPADPLWHDDVVHQFIGYEPPGPPLENGFFHRAKLALKNYEFSNPSIVSGHFDPHSPFIGRNILLDLKALGFHFLCGCRVHSVREETSDGDTTFGYRYDTLEGHLERGFEWFLLTKNHQTGQIRFTIEAHWQLGSFPNWWTRLGFLILGRWFRQFWRRSAAKRLRLLVVEPKTHPIETTTGLAHGEKTELATFPL